LRFLSSFSGGCPQVSKKADLARFPRRLAWQALPLDGFLLFTGWPFTKNVELQCVSSAFGLACFPRLRSGQAGAAPPPACYRFAKHCGQATRRASETVG